MPNIARDKRLNVLAGRAGREGCPSPTERLAPPPPDFHLCPLLPVVYSRVANFFFLILAFFLVLFCTIMPFTVSFQKMDPNLGVIIVGVEITHSDASTIGANFFYVTADVASPRGSAP
jgi:hypothetical protein